MGQVLLYNINDPEKLVKLRLTLMRLGHRAREVSPEDFGHPIGYLLGLPNYGPGDDEPGELSREMLLMEGLSAAELDALLDRLRQVEASVALKAVATPHNLAWSSRKLQTELLREQQSLARRLPRRHKKRK